MTLYHSIYFPFLSFILAYDRQITSIYQNSYYNSILNIKTYNYFYNNLDY